MQENSILVIYGLNYLYKDWLRKKDNITGHLKTLMFQMSGNRLWKAMLGVKNTNLDPPQNQTMLCFVILSTW